MSTPYRLLESLVARYDERGAPVTPRRLAEQSEASGAAVRSGIDQLEACGLVARVDGGYRPTVTGRELLALDIEDEVIIVDTPTDR